MVTVMAMAMVMTTACFAPASIDAHTNQALVLAAMSYCDNEL